MTPDSPSAPSFSAGRKWSTVLHVTVATLAVFALVVMVNYLGARHFTRASWKDETPFKLSRLTLQVLQSLTNQVRVVVFFDPEEPLYSPVTELLNEYKLNSPKLMVETVNYVIDPGKANAIIEKYKLPRSAKDVVIFECNGKTDVVQQGSLTELDLSQLMSGASREVKRKAFLGERFFTSKIVSVTSPSKPKAYFLLGHGEHDPTNDSQNDGYGKFAALLQENNIQLGRLTLLGTNEVPADCQLLMIPGPMATLETEEQAKLEKYLNRGGRLLVLLRYLSRSGLEQLLTKWGVAVEENVVIDDDHRGGENDVILTAYGSHPIVKPLAQGKQAIRLILPRSVGKLPDASQNADAAQVVELATTCPQGMAVTDMRKGVIRPNATKDRQGTIPLMVAVEKGRIKGVNLDQGSPRLVVIGDSYFLDNQLIDQVANRDFAWLAVDWLLDRSQLLGAIGPRAIKEYKITMTHNQMISVRWILLVAVPGSILLLGVLVWFRRRF